VPQEVESASLVKVAGPVPTHDGQQAFVYRFADAQPFAQLVPLAVKTPDDQALSTLVDPRFDGSRFVLVAPESDVGTTTPLGVPQPLPVAVRSEMPREGQYRFTLSQPAPVEAFLSVSENWYPDWHATVDGKPAEVVRAQFSLMAVPVPAGAREVELTFTSKGYRQGRVITFVVLAGLIVLLVWEGVGRLRRARG